MLQSLRLFSFFFLLIVTSVSCQKAEEPLPVLRLGHAPHDHHSPLYIAAMNPDYFKKNGNTYLHEIDFRKSYKLISQDRHIATVILDSSTGGKELIRKLTEEYYDLSFGGVPAILKSIDRGSSIKILAPVMADGAGLVVGNHLPVTNWHDFLAYVKNSRESVKIGYKMAVSVQNLIFEEALRQEKIPFSNKPGDPEAQVVVLNLYGVKNLIPALQNGLIDGFVVNQPYLSLAEEKGVGKTITMLQNMPPEGKWQGTPCCALAGNTTFVSQNELVVETLLTLILRANRFIVDHPDKSAEQISAWLELPVSVEKRSLPTIKFTVDYDRQWQQGVDFWVETMNSSNALKDNVKKAYQQGHLEDLVYDRKLYERARKNL